MTIEPVTRREFIQQSSAVVLGSAGRVNTNQSRSASARSVIQILMTGGPSHLDTWDPKPDAPVEIRGPFQSMATRVPGIRISELLPELAQRADRWTLLRTLGHHRHPIHETGLQLLQTGRSFDDENQSPHFGAVLAYLTQHRADPTTWWIPSGPLGDTGVPLPQGQSSGTLGSSFDAVIPVELANAAEKTPGDTFLRSCRWALRQVERGPSVITINMFPGVFDQWSWDMHASSKRLFVSFDSYRNVLAPLFDRAVSELLDGLTARGLLEEVLVVAGGEMGRSPRINAHGGRDHWSRCWSMLLAGGGVQGGQVLGRSDVHGAEPVDRPIHPAEVVATIYDSLGIDRETSLPNRGGECSPIATALPIREIF